MSSAVETTSASGLITSCKWPKNMLINGTLKSKAQVALQLVMGDLVKKKAIRRFDVEEYLLYEDVKRH